MGFGFPAKNRHNIISICQHCENDSQSNKRDVHLWRIIVRIFSCAKNSYNATMKTFVLFGSTGDLATRYVLPALGTLLQK